MSVVFYGMMIIEKNLVTVLSFHLFETKQTFFDLYFHLVWGIYKLLTRSRVIKFFIIYEENDAIIFLSYLLFLFAICHMIKLHNENKNFTVTIICNHMF